MGRIDLLMNLFNRWTVTFTNRERVNVQYRGPFLVRFLKKKKPILLSFSMEIRRLYRDTLILRLPWFI